MNVTLHGTTILAVRRGRCVALAGDGQVTMKETIMKHRAKKVRKIYEDRILVGFAGVLFHAVTPGADGYFSFDIANSEDFVVGGENDEYWAGGAVRSFPTSQESNPTTSGQLAVAYDPSGDVVGLRCRAVPRAQPNSSVRQSTAVKLNPARAPTNNTTPHPHEPHRHPHPTTAATTTPVFTPIWSHFPEILARRFQDLPRFFHNITGASKVARIMISYRLRIF